MEPTEKEWRCRCCGTLLGIEMLGKLTMRYKTATFVVVGTVQAICRRCSDFNEIIVPAPIEPAA